jgi:hypothetical protein
MTSCARCKAVLPNLPAYLDGCRSVRCRACGRFAEPLAPVRKCQPGLLTAYDPGEWTRRHRLVTPIPVSVED